MKAYFTLFLLFTFFSLKAAPDQDDVAVLNELVELTKKTLGEQENLQKLLVDFKKKREKYILDPDNAKLATQLVKSSISLKAEIEKAEFVNLFSEDLLTEVRFFAGVAKHE